MSQSHSTHPLNESPNDIQLQRFTHPHSFRHDFTPVIGGFYPINCVEMFAGRQAEDTVQHVTEAMPLAGNMKQDLNLYLESTFIGTHALWAKWPVFRYGRMDGSNTEVPAQVPYFTLRRILTSTALAGNTTATLSSPSIYLRPGGLLDSLYGLCSLLRSAVGSSGGPLGSATRQELLAELPATVLDFQFKIGRAHV